MAGLTERPGSSPATAAPPTTAPAGEGIWSPPNRPLGTSWPWAVLIGCLLLFLPVLQVTRIALFAATESGIEHDSGWYFGVARNLADRGIYATSSNVGATAQPLSEGVHYWPTLQDPEGFTYFCPGVTAGPGFVVPEAMVLKVLGIGWWQYRLLPLTVMLCLLVLLSSLAYWQGGALAVVLLQAWLWSLPLVTLKFGYEAYGEHLALFYSLLAFCAYAYALEGAPQKRLPWLAVGLLLSLSFLTKSLYVLSAGAVGIHLAWTFLRRGIGSAQVRALTIPLVIGFLLPWSLFEGYRFVSIVNRFGLDGYQVNNFARALVFRTAGSGLGSDWPEIFGRVLTKAAVLKNIGFAVALVAWPLVLLAGTLAVRPQAAPSGSKFHRCVATVVAVAGVKIALVLAWFVILSPSTFSRHAWDALLLIMLLTSIGVAQALRAIVPFRRTVTAVSVLGVLLAALNAAYFDFASVDLSPRLTYDRVFSWFRSYNPRGLAAKRSLQSLAFAPIFRRDLQEGAVQFLRRELRQQDRVYYVHQQKVAELPPLVGKVFFPINRYEEDQRTHHGRTFIILGPYQLGDWPWRMESKERIQHLLKTYKKQIVFQNDLYVVIREPFFDLIDLAEMKR